MMDMLGFKIYVCTSLYVRTIKEPTSGISASMWCYNWDKKLILIYNAEEIYNQKRFNKNKLLMTMSLPALHGFKNSPHCGTYTWMNILFSKIIMSIKIQATSYTKSTYSLIMMLTKRNRNSTKNSPFWL